MNQGDSLEVLIALSEGAEKEIVGELCERVRAEGEPNGAGACRLLGHFAARFREGNNYRIAVILWQEIIARLRGTAERELRAYYYNDLGIFLLRCGDGRAGECFHAALRLTRDQDRRGRTLIRYGKYLSLVRGEFDKAARLFAQARRLGTWEVCDGPPEIEAWHNGLLAPNNAKRERFMRRIRDRAMKFRAEHERALAAVRVPPV